MKQEVTKAEVINMDLDTVKFKKCCLGKINPKNNVSQNKQEQEFSKNDFFYRLVMCKITN